MSKCEKCINCMKVKQEKDLIMSAGVGQYYREELIKTDIMYSTSCLIYPSLQSSSQINYLYPNVIECNQFRSIKDN